SESELISRISEIEFKSKRLRTFLSKKELDRTLKALYRDAKVALEENGANTLYLAMGFLRWINPKDSPDADGTMPQRLAPLVLLPVDLVRRSRGTYELMLRDEDAQLNITLLEKLQQEFNLVIGGLDPLPLDEFGVDLPLVFNSIRRAVMHMQGWDVIEVAFLGLFSFSQFVMWNDLNERIDILAENKVVAGLLNSRYDAFEDDEVQAESLDEWLQTDKVIIPTSVDSSQLAAIIAATQGSSFVLHGPPGTGKSQTITNMIANALFNGKSVLFVAEKMAALNVVQKRLADLGLADYVLELHSNKTRKQTVLQQLEQNMRIETKTDLPEFERKISALQKAKSELHAQVVALHRVRGCGRSLYDLLILYQRHSTGDHPFQFSPEVLQNLTPENWDRWQEAVRRAGNAAERLSVPTASHPLREFRSSGYALNRRAEVEALLQELIVSTRQLRERLAQEKPETALLLSHRSAAQAIQEFAAICRERNFKTSLDAERIRRLLDPDVQRLLAAVTERAVAYRNFKHILYQSYNSGIEMLNWQAVKQQLLTAEKQFFLVRNKRIQEALQPLNALAKSHFVVNASQAPAEIDRIAAYQATKQQLIEVIQRGHYLFNLTASGDLETDIDTLEDLAVIGRWLQEQHRKEQRSLEDLLLLYHLMKRSREQTETVDTLELLSKIAEQLEVLGAFCGIDVERIFAQDHWLQNISEQLQRWRDHIDEWKLWSDFYGQIELLNKHGLTAVADGLLEMMSQTSGSDQVLSYYLASLAHDLVLLYLTESPELRTFSGYQFEEVIAYYNRLLDAYEQMTREQIQIRLSQRLPDARHCSQEEADQLATLKRVIRSKGRGTSIRQLFSQAGDVIRQMTPCFLMSPLSVAQYIDPSMPRFDLVIFDEASQIRTSVAVGAMSRAENCIIVGDPNQMPPTSFFMSQREREEYLEIEDLESLLEDCLAINMPERYLSWHYRSRSESLITFSNRMYYQSEMRTFPSPFDRVSKVRYHKIPGIYDKGASRTNRIEGEAVVDMIEYHYLQQHRVDDSIGVVTFSIAQQNLIDDILQERLSHNKELDQILQNVEEPIFIKNLENVQGDERDIILFSIGYGPDQDGKLTFNFGPLNRKGGWRRLNVAVSRSRKEMHIFASFEPEDIKLNQTSSEGLQGLRYFLEFARTGKLKEIGPERQQTAAVASDTWVESIARFLEKQGYEVVRQLGFSELNMDLAVVDPRLPDHYLCAIMVDGKQYADISTVRDRHRLLPSVFARMGWTIHTIWVLDWYDHPAQEKQKLLNFIETCLAGPVPDSMTN
ncbi:MAG TPA: DUF4011 domain-containing protein, partial [Clostridiaceae bacterium]|nr:DUF4011 domain-containing protein [Clostridiaceae bacterium]